MTTHPSPPSKHAQHARREQVNCATWTSSLMPQLSLACKDLIECVLNPTFLHATSSAHGPHSLAHKRHTRRPRTQTDVLLATFVRRPTFMLLVASRSSMGIKACSCSPPWSCETWCTVLSPVGSLRLSLRWTSLTPGVGTQDREILTTRTSKLPRLVPQQARTLELRNKLLPGGVAGVLAEESQGGMEKTPIPISSLGYRRTP